VIHTRIITLFEINYNGFVSILKKELSMLKKISEGVIFIVQIYRKKGVFVSSYKFISCIT